MSSPILFMLFTINLFRYTNSIPQRVNKPWTILLCKYQDFEFEPRPVTWFERWMDPDLEGSITNFYSTISNDLYTMKGSNVVGWFKMPYTRSDIHILAQLKNDSLWQNGVAHPLVKTHDLRIFDTIKRLCRQTARSKGFLVHEQTITVMNDQAAAMYCQETGVLLTPPYLLTSAATHEMSHSLGIGHSYSDQQVRVFPHALIGEYDDKYDLMSTANAFMYRTEFGFTGPGMNGPHLDYLGWLPIHRIVYFGMDKKEERRIKLASLSRPHNTTSGNLLVMIPYDRNDALNVYTIEFRSKEGPDTGILRSGVIIHQVRHFNGHYYSFLIKHSRYDYDLVGGTEWLQFIAHMENGEHQLIRITVNEINDEHAVADLTVRSTFSPTDGCLRGETKFATMCWPNDPNHRELKKVYVGDFQPNRTLESGDCMPGYIQDWFSPMPDKRCMTLLERDSILSLVANRNARNTFFERQTFGMNACDSGYVWRLADQYDYVCVTPEQAMTVMQDLEYVERYNITYSSESGCSHSTVTRDAFPGDTACVHPLRKADVQRENQSSMKHQLTTRMFNGKDASLFENGSHDHVLRPLRALRR